MASNIARDEFGYLSVYADEKPWHPEVGAIVKGAMTAEQVIKRSKERGGKGLGFEVATYPAYAKIGGKFVEAPDLRAIARVDTRAVFGFATADYKPLQNIENLRTLEAVAATKQAGFVSAGAIGNGSRLFATMDLRKLADVKIPGDPSKHQPMLCGTWSHDGREAFRIGFWDRRIECANMRAMWLTSQDKAGALTARIIHTGDIRAQEAEARRILGFATEAIKSHTLLMSQLADIAVNAKWMDGFLERLVPIPPEMERPRSREEAREAIGGLYRTSKTLTGVKPTAYRALQAVDEYADHLRPTRAGTDRDLAASRQMRNLLGDGPAADLKRRALELMREEFELKVPVAAGKN